MVLGARPCVCGCPGLPVYLFMQDCLTTPDAARILGLLSIPEAADRLGIKPTSLRVYLCTDSTIPRVHVLEGRRQRVYLSPNWVAERLNSVATRPKKTRRGYKANELQA